MSKSIWKFNAPIDDEMYVDMPEGAEVVHVGMQEFQDVVTFWAVVDPAARVVARHFAVRGTGHPLRKVGKHLGSYTAGPFVWHVFEGSGE